MSAILQLWQYLQSQGNAPGVQTVALPAGIIADFGGAAAPTGWLLCDGSAVSRTTFAALFTAIGTTFGVGNGTTTFNVPDCRGRSPVGAGNGAGLSPRALAATGGEETHQLSVAELASHQHVEQSSTGGDLYADPAGPSGGPEYILLTGTNATAGPFKSANTGGDTGHNTMHPFIALTKIISTG